MLSLLAAEYLLSFFTKPDRAASIAGDLLEEARNRRALWFWSQVVRTTVRFFARNLASAPMRASLLISTGCLLEFACIAIYIFLHGQLLNSAVSAAKVNLSVSPFLMLFGALFLWLWHITHPFLIGLSVARFARGREVSVCAAVGAVASAFSLAYAQYWLWTNRADVFWPERVIRSSADSLGSALVLSATIILGGIIVAARRRSIESAL